MKGLELVKISSKNQWKKEMEKVTQNAPSKKIRTDFAKYCLRMVHIYIYNTYPELNSFLPKLANTSRNIRSELYNLFIQIATNDSKTVMYLSELDDYQARLRHKTVKHHVKLLSNGVRIHLSHKNKCHLTDVESYENILLRREKTLAAIFSYEVAPFLLKHKEKIEKMYEMYHYFLEETPSSDKPTFAMQEKVLEQIRMIRTDIESSRKEQKAILNEKVLALLD